MRATIGPPFTGDVDDVLVEFGASDNALVQQPDVTTATLTVIATASPAESEALREAPLMPRLVAKALVGSNRRGF
jgi:hypothetical protein